MIVGTRFNEHNALVIGREGISGGGKDVMRHEMAGSGAS